MTKSHAEENAQSALERHRTLQEKPDTEGTAEQARMDYHRKMAVFGLLGAAIGAASASMPDIGFLEGLLFGGFAGHAIGWVVLTRWRR